MKEYFHFICRPTLVHRMTLFSFRLFRKNLGNLREFFGQMVHRPPWQKISRTPMNIDDGLDLLRRLYEGLAASYKF